MCDVADKCSMAEISRTIRLIEVTILYRVSGLSDDLLGMKGTEPLLSH